MSAKARRDRAKPLKRTSGARRVRRTIRVYSEGKATEPEYIAALGRLPELAQSVAVTLEIVEAGATPKTLVDRACEDKRGGSHDADAYWCVFDVESPKPHPYLDEARDRASANGVNLAISNPCFELWLVLHHEYLSRHVTTAEAEQLWQKLDGTAGKHLDPKRYLPKREAATQHAQRLRAKHKGDGTDFPHDNPSSSVDLFIAAVMRLARE